MSAVTSRSPRMISVIRFGGTPRSFAIARAERPSGVRYSSRSTSPGWVAYAWHGLIFSRNALILQSATADAYWLQPHIINVDCRDKPGRDRAGVLWLRDIKIVLAYSGGLDTSIILKWLQTT